jgi:hypothetical protein
VAGLAADIGVTAGFAGFSGSFDSLPSCVNADPSMTASVQSTVITFAFNISFSSSYWFFEYSSLASCASSDGH